MISPCTASTLLALGALIATPNCRANDYASPKDEIAAATTWYDSLQWPDVRGLPYMEFTLVETKDHLRWSGGRQTRRGFLISEDDEAYHAFCDGTTRRIFKNLPARSGPALPASARELGPTAAVDDEVADLRRPKAEDNPDLHSRPYFRSQWIPAYTHIFVLARCFARQSRTDLTEKLDKALALALDKRPTSRIDQKPDFRVAIEQWLCDDSILESTRDFSDLSIPRPRLLEEWERIEHGFPGADQRGVARAMAGRLRAMIAEDEAHAKTARPLDAMTPEEKAVEQIFRLRDENGLLRSMEIGADWRETSSFIGDPLGPASVSIHGAPDPSGPDGSPARQLIQLGSVAVPALIAALDDPCLTLSVEIAPPMEADHQHLDTTTTILTVGECAESILFYISGRHFGVPHGPAARQTAGQIDATRANAKQWWSDWQTKGEKQMLTEGVCRGDQESLEQARHLVALDADAAVQALVAGIAAAETMDVRADLIRELASMKDAATTSALRHEMKDNPHLDGRIDAAAELWQRGETDAVPAMIAEWTKGETSIRADPSGEKHDSAQLIDFLSSCGDPEAIKALAHRFPSLPVETKLRVLAADSFMDLKYAGADRKPLPADFAALHEDLIVNALDDHARQFGIGADAGGDGVRIYAPRVCDMAAAALTYRWPEKYPFQWKITRAERDEEIAQLRNSWRTSRGLAPLPIPRPPSIDAATLKDHNAVAACQWIGGPPLPDISISTGQPLTGVGIIQTILYLHHHTPHDCFGFAFSAERARGQSGIMVEIEWFPGPRPESPSHQACWSNLWLNDNTAMKFFWDKGPKDSIDPKENAQTTEQLDWALKKGVDQPFSFDFCWRWEKTLPDSPTPGRPPH